MFKLKLPHQTDMITTIFVGTVVKHCRQKVAYFFGQILVWFIFWLPCPNFAFPFFPSSFWSLRLRLKFRIMCFFTLACVYAAVAVIKLEMIMTREFRPHRWLVNHKTATEGCSDKLPNSPAYSSFLDSFLVIQCVNKTNREERHSEERVGRRKKTSRVAPNW